LRIRKKTQRRERNCRVQAKTAAGDYERRTYGGCGTAAAQKHNDLQKLALDAGYGRAGLVEEVSFEKCNGEI